MPHKHNTRFQRVVEYDIKPAKDLIIQGEFGFLFGAVFEKIQGKNPYFWYRNRRNMNQIVTRSVRDHEMFIDLYDRGISRHLFIRGVHEPHATAAYRDALAAVRDITTSEITVLDIGANIGYYVLEEVDVLGGRASVIAFEPDPKNRHLLECNIKHNHYTDQVQVSPLAVDGQSGERIFCRSTHSNWNRLARDEATGNVDELVERFSVETTRVDTYLDENGISPKDVNAVRMDLEGHELNVLDGMRSVLNSDGPLVLFIEFHPDFGDRDNYESALTTLEHREFTIRHVDQHWSVLDIESFEELRDIEGSHVRVVVTK